ncbi:MAG: hypothetical protein V2A64_02240 [Candidatus Omnitrophota bacterium]
MIISKLRFYSTLSWAGLTVFELLVALVLFSLIVLGFMNFDLFTHNQVLTADYRGNLQNELSFLIEHMNKNFSRAIGSEKANGVDSVVRIVDDGVDNITMSIYVDANGDGQNQQPPVFVGRLDYYVGYRYYYGGTVNQIHRIFYCGECLDLLCNPAACINPPNAGEELSNKINNPAVPGPFTKPGAPGALNGNFITVELSACWDPTGAKGLCGGGNNPSQTVRTQINMPSVTY